MAKGIIVLDEIPKNCRNIRGDKNGCPLGGMFCQICDTDVWNMLCMVQSRICAR